MATTSNDDAASADAVATGSPGADDAFAIAAEHAKVEGATDIYAAVRKAAATSTLMTLSGQVWRLVYAGVLPTEEGTAVAVQVTPAEAFEMTRIDARTFDATLVAPHALVTALGQLRDLGVRITAMNGFADAP